MSFLVRRVLELVPKYSSPSTVPSPNGYTKITYLVEGDPQEQKLMNYHLESQDIDHCASEKSGRH